MVFDFADAFLSILRAFLEAGSGRAGRVELTLGFGCRLGVRLGDLTLLGARLVELLVQVLEALQDIGFLLGSSTELILKSFRCGSGIVELRLQLSQLLLGLRSLARGLRGTFRGCLEVLLVLGGQLGEFLG